MSVPHPGSDPNAHLYEQLKRDVLEQIPHIRSVEYLPDAVEARHLRALFDPDRLTPPSGPESPELEITWYRQTPHDWFRVNYSDSNTGFHAGWHQDEDHADLGRTHFQYSNAETTERRAITFQHETSSLILWDIIEELLDEVLPAYQ